jgi:hypothetical protein
VRTSLLSIFRRHLGVVKTIQLSQATKRTRNLLAALADGIAGDTELFKEMLTKAETERTELIQLISVQEAQIKGALKPISAEEAKIASTKLKQLITQAPADLKNRYIRAFVSDIVVGKSEIKISGSKDALAEAISGEPLAHLAAASGPVRSFEREWCGREDSNFHGFYPTATSTLRVYQFRHGRTLFLVGERGNKLASCCEARSAGSVKLKRFAQAAAASKSKTWAASVMLMETLSS